jgi:putative PIN family toxin of toxin-antitoxin system
MRVIIDTNVLISAAIKHNSPPFDAVCLAAERHRSLKSALTERELLVTLVRPRLASFVPLEFRLWLAGLLGAAEPVEISRPIVACRDPKDDKFLELAVNGRADLIVSGDADLLALNPFHGVPIVTPSRFLQRAGR